MSSSKMWNLDEIEYLKNNYGKINIEDICKYLNRNEGSVLAKASKEKLKKPKKLNEHYFDIINTEGKAYWLGFIWSDGSLIQRDRLNRNLIEYNLKISLKESDYKHLEKFNDCIEGKYKVNIYKTSKNSSYLKDSNECRIFITNYYMGKLLVEKYGIFSYREDCSKCIENIPYNLQKHFIRGLLDADGSFTHYKINNNKQNKFEVSFGGQESLLRFIERYLVDNLIIEKSNRKLYKRHKEKERDGNFVSLVFCGGNQFFNILIFLYSDANIYLDRKYEKFINIKKRVR